MNSISDESAVVESSSPRRVLMVDDDKKFCRLMVEYLKPMGYDVVAAHTGPEGVEQALAVEWHAVILDVMLPGIDGLEVLRADSCVVRGAGADADCARRGDGPDRRPLYLEVGAGRLPAEDFFRARAFSAAAFGDAAGFIVRRRFAR